MLEYIFRKLFSKIISKLRVYPAIRVDVFASVNTIYVKNTCFLAPIRVWETAASTAYESPNVEVFINVLHGSDFGNHEVVNMSKNVAKGDKGKGGVNLNALNTEGGIPVVLRVKREDETMGECIKYLVEKVRKCGIIVSSVLLDRAYSCELIFKGLCEQCAVILRNLLIFFLLC